jgi:hypothetical protein
MIIAAPSLDIVLSIIEGAGGGDVEERITNEKLSPRTLLMQLPLALTNTV